MTPDLSRREAMQALSGLAAARWAEQDLDPDEADEWGELRSGYETGRHELRAASAVARGPFGGGAAFRDDVTDARATVTYGHSTGVSVHLDAEAAGADEVSAGLDLEPDEARELAVSIYCAAEELERWRDADG